MSAHHIVQSFDKELESLENKLLEMGKTSISMVERAVSSIVEHDTALAARIIEEDTLLDLAERYIGEKAVAIIAKRQPMAIDLRALVGAIRISADLERIGDMAKNIAKRARSMSGTARPTPFYRSLQRLSSLAVQQVQAVLSAYTDRSLPHVNAVRDQDEEVDAMYTSLFREVLTYMMEDPRHVTACAHLLFCAKNIERIGDHATNIAETVYYIITGDYMPGERPRNDSAFVVEE